MMCLSDGMFTPNSHKAHLLNRLCLEGLTPLYMYMLYICEYIKHSPLNQIYNSLLSL